jgi:hypothetical protein
MRKSVIASNVNTIPAPGPAIDLREWPRMAAIRARTASCRAQWQPAHVEGWADGCRRTGKTL